MMTRFARTVVSFWPTFILVVVLGGLIGLIPSYIMTSRPPLTIRDVREVDGVVAVGGRLELLVTLTRDRACDPRVSRWAWQYSGRLDHAGQPGKRWVSLGSGGAPNSLLGVEETYILSIPAPSNLTVGDWFYWSRTYDGCWAFPFVQTPPRESKNVPFKVMDPPLPNAPDSLEAVMPADIPPPIINPR